MSSTTNLNINFQGSMPDDDLSRNVYCFLGMPIDAIDMPAILRHIEAAAASKTPFLFSTPNLNFLVKVESDPDFRETLLMSDLCPTDGISIIWIARLMGVPIKNRITGSDIYDALKAEHNSAKPLKVFLFGGAEDVAAAACEALNVQRAGLFCVGSLYPGFCSVDEMSRNEIIDTINSSNADFLLVFLGTQNGQLWLQRNHQRLLTPVRAYLGSVVNLQAGTVRRAPRFMQKFGLEWLWRIKEEPYLWRRYWNDGCVLLRLLFTRVVPIVIRTWWLRLRYERDGKDLVIKQTHGYDTITVSLSGPATARHIDKVIPVFRDAIATKKQIMIDFSNTSAIDARFFGLLLMLRKKLKGSDANPIFIGLTRALESLFRLNGLGFLLSSDKSV